MARLATVPDIGSYLREQRVAAHLSLRQLAARAGMSNPYLSQVERGLRKPSAEILSALADALDLSAETLYVRAGILEPAPAATEVVAAIRSDPALTDRQRRALLDLYELFVAEGEAQGQREGRPEAVGEGPPDSPSADDEPAPRRSDSDPVPTSRPSTISILFPKEKA